MTWYVSAIVIFSLSVTVCEITIFKFLKWSPCESLTFKKYVTEYVAEWFFVPYKMMKKKANLSQTVFL